MAEFMSVVDTSQLGQIQELWNQLDSNRKGLVSVIDLQEVMKSVGVDASFEDVSEIIIELDSDGDGKISFKDFAKGVMRKQNKSDGSPSLPPSKSYPTRTSPVPLKSSSSPSPSPLSSSPSLSSSPGGKQSKTQKSEKENGKDKAPGSPAKFMRSPSVVQFVKHLTGPQLSEIQTLFNHYDVDKDGRIDHASVRSIVREINPAINSNDIQDLLNTIDSDRDGHVTFKEFIDGIVMVYRTNKKHAEKVAQEIYEPEEGPKTKKALKQTISKLQDDLTLKDITIEHRYFSGNASLGRSSRIHRTSPPISLSRKSPTSAFSIGEHTGAHVNRARAPARRATIAGSPDLEAHAGFCGDFPRSELRNGASLRTVTNANPSLLYLVASSRATARSCSASSRVNSATQMSSPHRVSILFCVSS
eukprot:Phypoly_transcript_04739.p1 GENE.Phypoly_transcript_04739~~Phypoly_transcript_04739.p1  ORF type:complete len:459 (+),score=99.46 Phypoly_transcript_04739:130-1377(+)